MKETLVDLLRHGEPVGGRRYRGQIDDPLSEKGWQQMRDAVGDHHPWDVVITSPLSRCQAFAQELCECYQLPLIADERLKEIGFGEWEGKTRDEITLNDPDRLQNFFRDPQKYKPKEAELLTDFEARVIAVWKEVLDKYKGRHILIIGHAGVMRMIICHVLNAPLEAMFHIQVPNAGITRIQVDGEGELKFSRLLFHAGAL